MCIVNVQSSLHENVVFSVCACLGNAAYIIFIMLNSTKHTCLICKYSFNTQSKLREHKEKKHQEDIYPCDHCKFKADSIRSLDIHIVAYHQSKRSKDIDMRSLKNRTPCNFSDPLHTNECCDRVPGPPPKFLTQEQRLKNGPCKDWLESECNFFCKFAHIQICHFQKQCRNTESCQYFHFDGINQEFLGGRAYQRSFCLNLKEFPPLPKGN